VPELSHHRLRVSSALTIEFSYTCRLILQPCTAFFSIHCHSTPQWHSGHRRPQILMRQQTESVCASSGGICAAKSNLVSRLQDILPPNVPRRLKIPQYACSLIGISWPHHSVHVELPAPRSSVATRDVHDPGGYLFGYELELLL